MGLFDGLFGGKKKTYVASVAYNIAGDEELRPDYLKSLVFRNILSDTSNSIGSTIRNGYLYGPGMSFRSFFRWADLHYEVGQTTGKLDTIDSVKTKRVQFYLQDLEVDEVFVQEAVIAPADYGRWIEQWFLANYPAKLDTDWTADIDEDTNEITVIFEGGAHHSFDPVDYHKNADYIYSYYVTETAPDVWSTVKMFIYRIGSGITELDNAVQENKSYGKFFPFMPVRLKGTFISNAFKDNIYEKNITAFKKITNGDYEELVDKIKDNDNLSDIDYAYLVMGIQLNTNEKACKKYLYNFFTTLMNDQFGGPSIYTDWILSKMGIDSVTEAWEIWQAAQSDPGDPLYGTPAPSIKDIDAESLKENSLRIKSTGDIGSEYNILITWTYITTGAGPGRIDSKANDSYWFEFIGEDEYASNTVVGIPLNEGDGNPLNKSKFKVQKIRLYHQISLEEGYTYLDIVGLIHRNYVYNGKFVQVTAKDGLKTQDEESGFIVPLQYEAFRNMRLVDSTQMTTSCFHLVFNSYEIKKTHWYETGFFKFLLVLVIAIVTAVFTGGAGFGLLGLNISVGSSLGFSGLTAAIVGSVANSLAAVVLVSIINFGATKIFGEEIGMIVGILASIILVQSITNFNMGDSPVFNWTELLKVDNLLKLTDAIGQAYNMYIQSNIEALAIKTQDYVADAQDKMADIREKYYEQFGGSLIVDPTMYVDSSIPVLESSEMFLKRTLMTGSDLTDMSHSMINDFTELSLTLPNAYS